LDGPKDAPDTEERSPTERRTIAADPATQAPPPPAAESARQPPPATGKADPEVFDIQAGEEDLSSILKQLRR
jgi:hypothetical protein